MCSKIKQTKKIPRASSCFFPEPGGRPLFLLVGGSEAAPAVPLPESAAWAKELADEEIGVDDKPKAMLPSGAYFLGLPRFFLAESTLNLIPEDDGGDPSKTPSEEGGLGCWRGGATELNGKPEPAGDILGLIIVME